MGWRGKFKQAVKGDGIYCFGSTRMLKEVKLAASILSEGHYTQRPYSTFYDVLMGFYLFYEDYEEVHWMPREEFWWMAAGLRWPTFQHPDGREEGPFMRSVWSEHMIYAFTHYQTVAIAGSGGCGKTLAMSAWGLMCWEYYMGFSTSASRVVFASVSENKLKSAFFAHITGLNRSSKRVGTYTGLADVRASVQLRRPNLPGKTQDGNRRDFVNDDKAIMFGALLGGVSEEQIIKACDKITGSHVSQFILVQLDEMQSCSRIPLQAAANLMTHPRIGRIQVSGNLGTKDDPLGITVEPVVGWEAIKPETCAWLGRDPDGREVYTIRFNNDYSPGIIDPKKYWFLPTLKKRDTVYPTPTSKMSPSYRRFWEGNLVGEQESQSILTPGMIEMSGASLMPDIDRGFPIINFAAFDSAPASIDRSSFLHCKLVVEKETQRWLLWFFQSVDMPKVDKASYYRLTSKSVSEEMSKRSIASGNIILDDSSSSGFSEELIRLGVVSYPVKFQSNPTDQSIDFSTGKMAKDHCYNLRAEMAVLLAGYVYNGQVRGINEDLIEEWKKELCSMRWKEEGIRGKAIIESKSDFKQRMGFSPDVLDTMMMAALFARTRFGLVPGARDNQLLFDRHFGSEIMREVDLIFEPEVYNEGDLMYTGAFDEYQSF